jgi:hypothetical protein
MGAVWVPFHPAGAADSQTNGGVGHLPLVGGSFAS